MINFATIRWVGESDGHVVIIDQTKLPEVFEERVIETVEDMWEAIKVLAVRGAPAIGVAGAYGMVLGLRQHPDKDPLTILEEQKAYLDSSRPTAVNLMWATQEVLEHARQQKVTSANALQCVLEKAKAIQQDDWDRCAAIGEHGKGLVKNNSTCLTHCNAGALATAGIGTALSVFYAAQKAGVGFSVYADETRPLLQGSRLTAWELHRAGIDVTVICDNMAGFLMSRKKVDLVVVGSDRIAANGDAANKIGTYSLAILAEKHNVPFYVAAPLSTFDIQLDTGDQIPIEERKSEEISHGFGKQTAPEGVKTWNPAFDVTPAGYIEGIITEVGILKKDSAGSFRSDIMAHMSGAAKA